MYAKLNISVDIIRQKSSTLCFDVFLIPLRLFFGRCFLILGRKIVDKMYICLNNKKN